MRRSPLCLLLLLVVACSSQQGGSTAPLDSGTVALGGPCAATSDCGPEMLCGYPITQACNAQGVCVAEDLTCASDGPVVCSCAGGPVQLACIWGSGFAPLPVVSTSPGCQPNLEAGLFD
jgi:hypothetical protein